MAKMKTIGEVLGYYMKARETAISGPQISSAVKNILQFMNGGDPISSIGVPECERFRRLRMSPKNGGVSSGTVRRDLSILQAAANYAAKHRKLGYDDLPIIELPPPNKPRTKFLSEKEVGSLFRAAKMVSPEIERFVILAYYTGARQSAVMDMRWSQVDFENDIIDLSGGKPVPHNKRRPFIPLAEPLRKEMIEWRVFPAGPTRRIVLAHVGRDFPMHRCRQQLKEAFKLAGLVHDEIKGAHILRKSRATHLVQAGVDIGVVAAFLGDSIATTIKHYAMYSPDYLKEAIRSARAPLDA